MRLALGGALGVIFKKLSFKNSKISGQEKQ